MGSCELCETDARVFCESDRARLCWSCDFKVHGANFLVARHTRTLLCHNCQLPTPWSASGSKLGPTVSLCATCSTGGETREGDEIDFHVSDCESESTDDDDDDDDDDDNDNDGDYHDDEEGDNQVVPWSCTPPPELNFSSGEE